MSSGTPGKIQIICMGNSAISTTKVGKALRVRHRAIHAPGGAGRFRPPDRKRCQAQLTNRRITGVPGIIHHVIWPATGESATRAPKPTLAPVTDE